MIHAFMRDLASKIHMDTGGEYDEILSSIKSFFDTRQAVYMITLRTVEHELEDHEYIFTKEQAHEILHAIKDEEEDFIDAIYDVIPKLAKELELKQKGDEDGK